MVCGAVCIHLTERRDRSAMPRLVLTMKVMSIDRHGHIVWPATFPAPMRLQLRNQARALIRRMMADPTNPLDESFMAALAGPGSESVHALAP